MLKSPCVASPHCFSHHSSEVFGLSTCTGEVAFTEVEGSVGSRPGGKGREFGLEHVQYDMSSLRS